MVWKQLSISLDPDLPGTPGGAVFHHFLSLCYQGLCSVAPLLAPLPSTRQRNTGAQGRHKKLLSLTENPHQLSKHGSIGWTTIKGYPGGRGVSLSDVSFKPLIFQLREGVLGKELSSLTLCC